MQLIYIKFRPRSFVCYLFFSYTFLHSYFFNFIPYRFTLFSFILDYVGFDLLSFLSSFRILFRKKQLINFIHIDLFQSHVLDHYDYDYDLKEK
jgi:hypothetical protein